MLLSINHLFREKVGSRPDDVILAVPDKSLKFIKYSYKDLDVAATLLAKYYVDSNSLTVRPQGDSSIRMTVGLLSQSNFDYVINELALARMGYCILLISPNNSPAAISYLLSQTNAEAIIVSEQLVDLVKSALETSAAAKLILQPSPEIYNNISRSRNVDIQWAYPLDFEQEADLPFVIIHSSGSTGYPKAIAISHKSGLNNYAQVTGYKAFTTLPLYHNHGHSNFYRAIYSGRPLYMFPGGLIPLTNDNILSLLNDSDCEAEAVFTVPLILNILATSQDGINALRKMKLVMSGGSALPDEVGDKLVAEGVRLVIQMGTTETGALGTSVRNFEIDKDWCYARASEAAKKYIRFDDQGDGKYELVVLSGYPTLNTTNQPDGSYRTKDLYHLHSTLDYAFKFCGRLDDTLVMINGEKTNPVPMELALKGLCPYISDVILFGSGRAQIGALILPSELGKDKIPQEFCRLIAPALAAANLDAPSHSQLAEEAIIFLPFGTRIPRTDKGSFIRAKAYKVFEKEIEELYRRLEGEGIGEGSKIKLKDLRDAKMVVWECMRETLNDRADALDEEFDLFAFGLNSLQAARVRNGIQRRVNLGRHKISPNLVFEHPSIKNLSAHLLDFSLGLRDSTHSDYANEMLDIVGRFRNFPLEVDRESLDTTLGGTQCGRGVLLTGATGSLGAYLLDTFLSDAETSLIYCLARATSNSEAWERVAQSMRIRELTEAFTKFPTKLICLAADFSREKLGVSDEEYDELRRNVTVVIHCAWPVNFNLAVESFIPHIQGAVNLMKLALGTTRPAPAHFYFCSSISAVISWPNSGDIPEKITNNPRYAQDMGYARSKWIVERLCQIASETSPLKARVLRIGQLAGDSKKGIWNESEAISLMFKSAQKIGVLPELEESIAWLPTDLAAQIIHELACMPETEVPLNAEEGLCFHVVQPKRIPWNTVLDYFERAGLDFKPVTRQEWLEALRTSDPDPVQNPTIKLLTFFENKYDGETIPVRPNMDTTETERCSVTLRNLRNIDEGLVKKWLGSWRKRGFMD